jgi:hypothetical protein
MEASAMTGDQFDAGGEAREALCAAVTSYGMRVLNDPRILGNLMTDLLPGSLRERSLLVAAAEAGVASELSQHVEQQHLPVDAAVAMVARGLAESRAIDLAASTWVTAEYAQALGYQVQTASDPPSSQPDANSTPMTDTVHRPRHSPQAEPSSVPQPRGADQQSAPQVPPVGGPQGPTFTTPTAAVPPTGTTAPPGHRDTTPPGTVLSPAAFAPAGYPQPTMPASTSGDGKRKRRRRTAIIAAALAVVLAGGGTAAAIALTPSHTPMPRGATWKATFTAPDGGTFSSAAFTPDGTLIMAAGGTGYKTEVYFFSATSRKYIGTIKVPRGDAIYPLALTQDNQGMIAADCGASSCYIYEWDISTGQHSGGPHLPQAQFAVNNDGSVEANETRNGQFIDTYDLQKGKRTGHFPNPTAKPIAAWSIRVSADGQRMLISAVDGTTYVMSAQTGQTLAQFHFTYAPNPKDPNRPQGPVPLLSPDGKTVAIPGTKTAPPQIWNVATGGNVTPKDARWPKTDPTRTAVDYSSDGTVVVTAVPNAPYADVWNVDLGSYSSRITIPGSNDWAIYATGPSGSEVLFGSNPDKSNDSATLYLYHVP